MKKLMMAGGFSGFLTGLVCGILQHGPWPTVLWRATIGAVCAGFLLRWWGGLFVRSLLAPQGELAEVAPSKSVPPLPPLPKR